MKLKFNFIKFNLNFILLHLTDCLAKIVEAQWPNGQCVLFPERVVWVQALAGDIVLCSWARHLTLTVPLSGKLLGKPNKLSGSDLRWTSLPSRGSRNTPSRFMLRKPEISTSSMSQSWLQGLTFLAKINRISLLPHNILGCNV